MPYLHIQQFSYTKISPNMSVKSHSILIHNGKLSKQITLSIIKTFDTRDLPDVEDIQWSTQDGVPWAWLINVEVSGKSKDLSIKHQLFVSQKLIYSEPNTDSDCMSAL